MKTSRQQQIDQRKRDYAEATKAYKAIEKFWKHLMNMSEQAYEEYCEQLPGIENQLLKKQYNAIRKVRRNRM